MIIYKSEAEIEMMRQSSQIVARILSELKDMIRPGLETRELDWYAERRARELGAVPAFKGYRGYPASLCVSINEEIVHGIPSSRRLQEGDIVSLDFGVVYEGFYGDAALTVPVGQVSELAQRLIEVVKRAFYRGLEELKLGSGKGWLFGHPGFCRSRHRAQPARGAPAAQFRAAGSWPAVEEGLDPGHRADDCCRPLGSGSAQ